MNCTLLLQSHILQHMDDQTFTPVLVAVAAGFIDDKARFPRRLLTLCIDGVCILIGSLLGTSPLTVVAESSVGIKEGGRTGITAFALGCGFVIAMFFSPIFSSIPG